MIPEAIAPGVPPVNALRLVSPTLTALPYCEISSPGAATQRTIPPNALNDNWRRCSVAARCGIVVAEKPGDCAAARAAVAQCSGAFFPFVPRVIEVAATVESRARTMKVGAEAVACPPR